MLVAKWGIITLWIDVKENHLLVIARENVQTPSRWKKKTKLCRRDKSSMHRHQIPCRRPKTPRAMTHNLAVIWVYRNGSKNTCCQTWTNKHLPTTWSWVSLIKCEKTGKRYARKPYAPPARDLVAGLDIGNMWQGMRLMNESDIKWGSLWRVRQTVAWRTSRVGL